MVVIMLLKCYDIKDIFDMKIKEIDDIIWL